MARRRRPGRADALRRSALARRHDVPVRMIELPAGIYQITLRRQGYATWRAERPELAEAKAYLTN